MTSFGLPLGLIKPGGVYVCVCGGGGGCGEISPDP